MNREERCNMRYSKMPLEAARREARLEQLRERLASSDPALVPFAIQWAEDMERRMAAEHKHVRQVASAALAAQVVAACARRRSCGSSRSSWRSGSSASRSGAGLTRTATRPPDSSDGRAFRPPPPRCGPGAETTDIISPVCGLSLTGYNTGATSVIIGQLRTRSSAD